jgi:wyosine [tRNA(Phe)-imidazoG37] synthetase (radical SAM superfamily)
MSETGDIDALRRLFAEHPRSWRENLYVYPVISRRSGGLSIGVNLNPDKACNFDCVYCQVDRSTPPTVRKVELDRLRVELESLTAMAVDGRLFEDPQFGHVPKELRRINDIAFSGDGEPTTCPRFPEVVDIAADVRADLGLDEVKLVLTTDAAYLSMPKVKDALAVMDANNGEIWAKLDAGTETYYELINRPNVALQTLLDNILDAARIRPVVIQSLWMHVREEPPPGAEIRAFAERLRWILDEGGRIKLVQVYTIARQSAEPWVTPLPTQVLEAIAAEVRQTAGLPTAVYGT